MAAGEVVALVGDNGAGKSTLVKTLAGVHQPDAGGVIEFEGKPVTISDPSTAISLGIATVFQDLALCENLDVVSNLFLGQELSPLRLDEVQMETRSWELLHELSARIPSLRTAVASLSGGQRQTVAIARSLLLDPKVIVLDEPTAALGVAQTAEVLDLIERVRARGLGVVMISHNMDVRAVADRVVVLRLGRNNGVFDANATNEELVSAITGRDRQLRLAALGAPCGGGPARGRQHHQRGGDPMSTSTTTPPQRLDRMDERLAEDVGVAGRSGFGRRVRAGDIGALPVVVGLVIIWTVFQSLNPVFLSSNNLVNLLFDSCAVGTIALGIVCVLMLGEIDLSVGSVSGMSSAVLGVLWVSRGVPLASRWHSPCWRAR